MALQYRVGTLRESGLEAKWGKTREGAPIIYARDPKAEHEHQRTAWWAVDRGMWKQMEKQGIREGFNSATLLGEIFSI
jgi:hypothetical protein